MVMEFTGDLFGSDAPAICHGVNCQGVMGAGIAAIFQRRYPDMYNEYRMLCQNEALQPGGIFPYRGDDRYVINIASQYYPGPDAKMNWLTDGLLRTAMFLRDRGIPRLAMPQIGCGIGGLRWESVSQLLEPIEAIFPGLDIEVWSLDNARMVVLP